MNLLIFKNDKSVDDYFDIASYCSRCLNSNNEENKQEGRNILILILDSWDCVPENIKPLFVDLISAAGFYPYVDKLKLKISDLGESIRFAYHKSDVLENVYFHSMQMEINELIKQGKNVIVSAPTSFGKSMLIEEIVASTRYRNIVIIQPTLALLDETRRKLRRYSKTYKIIVQTSQRPDENKGNIFLLTAERVLEYVDMPVIDILVLDEFYKMSSTRGDSRSSILNIAFVRLLKKFKCQFYMLGPNIDEIPEGFTDKYNASFVKTNFSMVITNDVNRYERNEIYGNPKNSENELFSILDNIQEQSLIFCSSPNKARKLAFEYRKHLDSIKTNKTNLSLTKWLEDNFPVKWSLIDCLYKGIGVHDGSMPKHITSSTIKYFNSGELKYLFCTNTIIEGVNTSAKNVIYYDNKIGPRKVDYFDYSNIKGRAGRLMEHFVGNVINLKKPPTPELMKVDFPFFQQNPVDTEVLVNMDANDILDINDNKTRYNEFMTLPSDLRDILIRNGVSISGQLKIIEKIEHDILTKEGLKSIQWSRIDSDLYKHIEYICELCWENLSTKSERRTFGSRDWVVNKLVSYCYKKSIIKVLQDNVDYYCHCFCNNNNVSYEDFIKLSKYSEEYQSITDKQVLDILGFQRNWLSFRFPKWLNVVDSLQKYVSCKKGIISGDYSYIADMVENGFISSEFRILLEYGVPQSTVSKIQNVFKNHNWKYESLTEEQIIKELKNKSPFIYKCLSAYEMELIEYVL